MAEDIVFIFTDISLPAAKTASNVTEEASGYCVCCGMARSSRNAIFFQLLLVIFSIGDSATNIWEWTQFDRASVYNSTEYVPASAHTFVSTEYPRLSYTTWKAVKHLANLWHHCLIMAAMTAVFRIIQACYTINTLRKANRTVRPSTKDAESRGGDQKCLKAESDFMTRRTIINYMTIGIATWEFFFEICGISCLKLIIAFKSPTALKNLMTTSSIVSGTVTLILMLFEMALVLHHACKSGFIDVKSCCDAKSLANVMTLVLQTFGIGAATFSAIVSYGAFNIDNYSRYDFKLNIAILGGATVGSSLLLCFIVWLYQKIQHCKSNSNHD